MHRNKRITILIAPDGTCQVDAINFTGPSCQMATSEITAALGGQIDHQRTKPEMRAREPNRQPGHDQERAR